LFIENPEVCSRAVSTAFLGGYSAFGGSILLAASPNWYPNPGAQRQETGKAGELDKWLNSSGSGRIWR